MLQANVISYNATIDACQDWQCDKDLEQEIGIQLKLKVTWTWYDAGWFRFFVGYSLTVLVHHRYFGLIISWRRFTYIISLKQKIHIIPIKKVQTYWCFLSGKRWLLHTVCQMEISTSRSTGALALEFTASSKHDHEGSWGASRCGNIRIFVVGVRWQMLEQDWAVHSNNRGGS